MDQEKEILEIGKRVATLEAVAKNHEGWQKSQNGAIHRVEDKVDALIEKLGDRQFQQTVMAVGIIVNLALGVFLAVKGVH
jgi:hypothetical protein